MSRIKSIQRGTYQPAASATGEITISLSTRISSSKAMIFIQPHMPTTAGYIPFVSLLTDTTFKSFGGTWIEYDNSGNSYYARATVLYQVIEFE